MEDGSRWFWQGVWPEEQSLKRCKVWRVYLLVLCTASARWLGNVEVEEEIKSELQDRHFILDRHSFRVGVSLLGQASGKAEPVRKDPGRWTL